MENRDIAPNSPNTTGNTIKDPEDWTTGDEPMTGAQRSYLQTLCQEANEPLDETLTKAQASERIEALQQKTGRGTGADRSPSPHDSEATGNSIKDPKNWTTGDEPMTGAQHSYLQTLCQEANEPLDETLTKAQASERIEALQQKTGRGTGADRSPSPHDSEATGNPIKDPEDWTTGDEPMTGAQRSYLQTLCQEANEPMDETLTKAQASERIEALQQKTGRGTAPSKRSPPQAAGLSEGLLYRVGGIVSPDTP